MGNFTAHIQFMGNFNRHLMTETSSTSGFRMISGFHSGFRWPRSPGNAEVSQVRRVQEVANHPGTADGGSRGQGSAVGCGQGLKGMGAHFFQV